MGGENDTVAFTDLFADRCDFSFGGGHDNVGFDTMSCAEVRIRGGAGQDHIVWQGGGATGDVSISTSSGEDHLTLETISVGGQTRVTMAGGNGDFLEVDFCAFAGPVHFSGGSGNPDAFSDGGTNEYATAPTVVQFEQ